MHGSTEYDRDIAVVLKGHWLMAMVEKNVAPVLVVKTNTKKEITAKIFLMTTFGLFSTVLNHSLLKGNRDRQRDFQSTGMNPSRVARFMLYFVYESGTLSLHQNLYSTLLFSVIRVMLAASLEVIFGTQICKRFIHRRDRSS